MIRFILFLLFPVSVEAVCPVCTVTVGAGLGISRWFGIDDTITGVWIGGVILSSALWLADWVRKKGWKVPYLELLSIVLMIFFVIPPLYWSHMIGIRTNTLWGIDKILLGTMIGAVFFLFGVAIDKWLRAINKGKGYVYFQKVLTPVFLLSVASLILYLITSSK